MAELTYCEGWCGMSYTLPVVRRVDGFEMAYGEPYTNGKGRPLPDRNSASVSHPLASA
jgi:hypothetical protein